MNHFKDDVNKGKIATKSILGTLKERLVKDYKEARKNLGVGNNVIKTNGIIIGEWMFTVTLRTENQSIVPSITNLRYVNPRNRSLILNDPNIKKGFNEEDMRLFNTILLIESEGIASNTVTLDTVGRIYDSALSELGSKIGKIDPLMLQILNLNDFSVDVFGDRSVVLVPYYDMELGGIAVGLHLGVEICRSTKEDGVF